MTAVALTPLARHPQAGPRPVLGRGGNGAAVAARPRRAVSRPGAGARALVLRAPGTNCDRETALALEVAGARPERVHVEALLADPAPLDEAGLLVLPGGFSFGDHLGAGRLWAHRLEGLREALDRFVAGGRPVLGICNGFQALLALGLLDGGALAPNRSGHFECRWVWLAKPAAVASPLLAGIERLALPVAHGEGRFVAADAASLRRLGDEGRIGLVYADAAGPTSAYPANPNRSEGAVAALLNETGNVLGLMPHPERNVLPGQAPAGRPDAAGLAIFRNAVKLARG